MGILVRATHVSEALEQWQALSTAERTTLLDLFEERFVVPRPIEVYIGEMSLTNDSGVELIKQSRAENPSAWSYEQLVFLTTLWLWELSKIALTELNEADLGFSLLWDFFADRWRTYETLAGVGETPPPESLFQLVRALPPLREQVEKKGYLRCMEINGASWERREWWMPRSALSTERIPDAFLAFVEGRLGVEFPTQGDYATRFRAWTDALVGKGINPAEGLVALAEYVLTLPQLRADYAIVTCARGVKFDEPWKIQLMDVMSYTAIRPGYDPTEHGVRLNRGQISNAIAQRMRYNVVCRCRNFSPLREERMQAQSFQFPDVAAMEDAHHNGHVANGVRFVTRAPFLLDVAPSGRRTTLRGLADLRVNRASHRAEDRFTRADLPAVITMSLWMKATVERAFELGVLLDDKYCNKLDYYTDKDGGRVDRGGILRR